MSYTCIGPDTCYCHLTLESYDEGVIFHVWIFSKDYFIILGLKITFFYIIIFIKIYGVERVDGERGVRERVRGGEVRVVGGVVWGGGVG